MTQLWLCVCFRGNSEVICVDVTAFQIPELCFASFYDKHMLVSNQNTSPAWNRLGTLELGSFVGLSKVIHSLHRLL